MRTKHDVIEDFAGGFARLVRTTWLRIKFATGGWRGVMVHADRKGRMTGDMYVTGLRVSEHSPEFEVYLCGDRVISINCSSAKND